MNKTNIYGVSYFHFLDILDFSKTKIQSFSKAILKNPLSKIIQVPENGIINFHNFSKLSRNFQNSFEPYLW